MTATDALPGPENRHDDQPEIRFSSGLVGYPAAQRFVLEQCDGGVFELRGLDDGPDFVVVAPAPFFPNYAPVIDDEWSSGWGCKGRMTPWCSWSSPCATDPRMPQPTPSRR